MNTKLIQHFEELYDAKNWFKKEEEINDSSSHTEGFSICTSGKKFRRISRTAKPGCHLGEKYTIKNLFEYQQEGENFRFNILTSEYYSVQEARHGFINLLIGAEQLKSQAEGAAKIGDLSFEKKHYLCFVRNNVCVSISAAKESYEQEVLRDLAQEIDQQIVDTSFVGD